MTKLTALASSSLCDQFGLGTVQRRQRLAFLELSDEDHAHAAELISHVINPNIDSIIDQFYAKLITDPGAFSFIENDEVVGRLKQTQKKHLLSLGIGFDSEAYFDNRLRVGLVHDQVGLPLTTYQCAYNALQQIIIVNIRSMLPAENVDAAVRFLLKIISLDMSLAIEAYHGVQVQGLERSLDHLKDRQRSLQRRVSIDELTEVLSRSQILEDLRRCMQHAKDHHHYLSIIMLDIDFFKRVNDQYGHPAGDLVLMQVAQRFKTAVRNVDMVGRYGGEEFLVVLPDADIEISKQIAERIRAHVVSSPINNAECTIHVSVSGGIAVFDEMDSIESMIDRADKALYQAKEAGRNRVICH